MAWNPGQPLFGDRYIIERKLGEGGVGITYLAKNRRGELRVIKTLREQILNHPAWISHQDKLRQDFRDEALRLALCRHPHIVQVENVFDEGNLPCMAMEYIQGEDLGKLITEKGALPEAEALLYIRQIGEALILVHEKGLLHRDLKPSNIMMRAGKPEAVLIDFGLARQFISGGVLQHTQSVTPGYAPPEQYAPIEQRGEYIDVYALAATLYSLVTGELPMPAPARLQNFTMQPPQDLNSSVSDRVNNAIMRGMALNYNFRPQSVQDWLDLLRVGTIPPTQPVTPTPQPPIQNPKSPTPVVAVPETWECVNTLTGHSKIVNSIAFSPDGRTLASGGWDKKIKIWEVTSGKLLRTLGGWFSGDSTNWVRSVVFSSDGRTLADGSSDKTIKIWEVQTGKQIRTLRGHSDWVRSVVFSPDGRTLASGSNDETIKIWEVQTGKQIRTLTGHSNSVISVAFSPDGRTLASGSFDKKIKIWEVQTGKEIRTLTNHSGWFGLYSVVFSPDGRTLASGSFDNTIKIWEVQTGKQIRTLTGHSNSVSSVVFSPDGRTLASGSDDNTIKIWRSQLVVE